ADVTPVRVEISNGGSGTLDGLTLGAIDYKGGPSGWLTATLDRAVAPAAITIGATARSLSPGTYTATLPVQSTADGIVNSPAVLTVSFVVAPKPFRFVISPASVSISYSIGTHTATRATVSLLDANGSGQVATVTRLFPTLPPGGNCPQ